MARQLIILAGGAGTRLRERLGDLPLTLPSVGADENRHAYHLYSPLLDLDKLSVDRQQVVSAIEAENIGVGIHYEPVHTQPFYTERFGRHHSNLPNATYIGERTLSLPLSAGMSESDAVDVCHALRRILDYYAT